MDEFTDQNQNIDWTTILGQLARGIWGVQPVTTPAYNQTPPPVTTTNWAAWIIGFMVLTALVILVMVLVRHK